MGILSPVLQQILFRPGANSVALTLSGNEITDAVRALGVQGDGLPQGSGFGIWPAATNLEANGGAETNTTGHAAGGTNTVARSTAQAKFGAASFLCTYQDNAVLDSVALTLTAAVHSAQRHIYIPTAYDGTQISVQFSGYVGATGTLSVNADMALRDQWQRVVVPNVTIVAGDLVGAVIVSESGTPTAGRFIYVDGCQTEALAVATPYIETDGATAARSAARVQAPVAGLFTPAQGWVAIRFRAGWGSDPGTTPTFFSWADAGNDRIELLWTAGSYTTRRDNVGVGDAAASVTNTPSLDDFVTLLFKWHPTAGLSLSRNGAAFVDGGAGSNIPTLSAATCDLGTSSHTLTRLIASSVLWFACGKGTLGKGDAALINSFGSNDVGLEAFPGEPTGFWSARNGFMEIAS